MDQNDNDQDAIVYNKLKAQQTELKSIFEAKNKKNTELNKIKVALVDQEIEMRSATIKASDYQTRRIEEIKQRRDLLEKQRLQLTQAISDQTALEVKLRQDYEDCHKNYGSLASPLPANAG